MRDNLDYLSRELTTISILAGLGNVNSQLFVHMNICMNLGMTSEQMYAFTDVLKEKINEKIGDNAKQVAGQVIQSRKNK